MAIMLLIYLTYIAGLMIGFSMWPQMFRVYKNKSVKGISPASFAMFSVASVIWLLYGVNSHQPQIVIMNALAITSGFGILLGFLIFMQSRY